MDSNTLINALSESTAYPHPVKSVQLIETHISWVFLTGDFAYKVKKPVDFGFLDFSSLEKRHFFCEEELRLNRRYAPDIYLDIVPVTLHNGTVCLGKDGKAGVIIDYAVKMRQFDTTKTLDKLAEQQGLTNRTVHQIGRNLAQFHNQLMTEELPSSGNMTPPPGSPEAIWQPMDENFRQIIPLLENRNHLNILAEIESCSRANFDALKPLLQQRYDNGFIRECHGDLHLGNMANVSTAKDDRILFFDCIEFNINFRQIDVMCELAFTLMDLEARGMPVEANSLLNTYLEYRPDFDGLKLLDFYKTYYAIVRAKVSLLETGSSQPGEIQAHHKYDDFVKYINLAKNYSRPVKTFIAITHGLSGSGKSTIAEKIAGATGAIRIRSDVERKRLFNLQPHEASDKTIYTRDASQKTFQRLQSLMDSISGMGYPVIVDATFLHYNLRERFANQADKLNQPFWIVDCKTPIDTLEQRLEARIKAGQDASEADIKIMKSQKDAQQPLTAEELKRTVCIDTTKPVMIDNILSKLLT